jgi:hypothetical protein
VSKHHLVRVIAAAVTRPADPADHALKRRAGGFRLARTAAWRPASRAAKSRHGRIHKP